MTATVLRPGLLSSLQDLGRRARHLGVPQAGALDSAAARVANALVGNAGTFPVLEVTLLGPRLRFDAPAVVALCGAPFEARLDGQEFSLWRAVQVPAGSLLDLGATRRGVRAVLAVRGGWQAETVLGSASTDLRGGFGGCAGRAVRTGDLLAWHGVPDGPVPRGTVSAAFWPRFGPLTKLRVLPTGEGDLSALTGQVFTVSSQADRMGLRLLENVRSSEVPGRPSEPTVVGGIQLPPGGSPIVLLNDAGTHGGYPLPAAVVSADHGRLAQLRPGDRLRFEPVTLPQAQAAWQHRESGLRRLEAGLRLWWGRS